MRDIITPYERITRSRPRALTRKLGETLLFVGAIFFLLADGYLVMRLFG
jgi:hypothetical protein